MIDRLAGFASALGALDRGLTILGGEPFVQIAFTRRILSAAKKMGLHAAIETSGYLGDRVEQAQLSVQPRPHPARHQEFRPGHLWPPRSSNRSRVGSKLALRRAARGNVSVRQPDFSGEPAGQSVKALVCVAGLCAGHALRRVALQGTELAQATAGTHPAQTFETRRPRHRQRAPRQDRHRLGFPQQERVRHRRTADYVPKCKASV